MTRRTERVSEELRGELARLLHEEATDPRLRFVTLTKVDVSPDFARADVFWSTVDDRHVAKPEQVGEALERAAGFLRHRLAAELPLRRMPALHFRHDPSLAAGDRALAILKELARESTNEE